MSALARNFVDLQSQVAAAVSRVTVHVPAALSALAGEMMMMVVVVVVVVVVVLVVVVVVEVVVAVMMTTTIMRSDFPCISFFILEQAMSPTIA